MEHDPLASLLAVVERSSNRVFAIDAMTSRAFSYEAFHRLSCDLAACLERHGTRRGEHVVVVLDNSAEFAMVYVACLYLGCAIVPINPRLHPDEIGAILAQSGAATVIHSSATAQRVRGMTERCPGLRSFCLLSSVEGHGQAGLRVDWSVERAMSGPLARWSPCRGVTPDDLFSITFTSGSTGVPKGVAHRIGSLVRAAQAFNEAVGVGPQARFYHVLPMSYMAGFLNALLCPLLAGGSVIISPVFDARTALGFWRAPMRHEATALWLVPSVLAVLMRIDRDEAGIRYCRRRIRTACVGTAPLPVPLKRAFEERYGVRLLESYGLSETLFVTAERPGAALQEGAVGAALPGVDIQIADGRGPLPPDVQGEIRVRTPFLMAGYLDEGTREPDPLVPGTWFETGDLGHVDPSGALFITGRKKDLIVRGGINVSPQVVEGVLGGHEAVEQAAVVGLPHELYGEEIVAAVKLKQGYSLDEVRLSLDRLCRERLSEPYVPDRFVAVEEFPVGTSGKVQKAALRERLTATLGAKAWA